MTITRRGLHEEIERLDSQITDLNSAKAAAFDAYREQLQEAGAQRAEVTDEIAACKMAFRQLRAAKKNPAATADRHALVDEIVAEITIGTVPATRVRVREEKPRAAAPSRSAIASSSRADSGGGEPVVLKLSTEPGESEPASDPGLSTGSIPDDDSIPDAGVSRPTPAAAVTVPVPIPSDDDDPLGIPTFLRRAPGGGFQEARA
jgi:hypothetical protein